MSQRRQPRYSKGQRIANRFLVHQALMGGMGEVYLCLDEQSMLPFALKTFQGSSANLYDIFRGEVASWIALEKHPNIVRCFHMEKYDNIPFMALEWVVGEDRKGTDLRSWLQHGPLELPLALRFTIDIVRGLIHANEKVPCIVHRDLKPDNVLVNQSRQAKITDFGLATIAQSAKLDPNGLDETDMGQSRYVGNVVGTPAYMPPEQWRGDTDIDFRADIYAVGCILYELLTGKWLYEGYTVSELRAKHLESPLPSLNNNLPAELKPILEGCLAKRREDRFSRLDLLLADLTQLYEAHSDEPLPEVSAEAFTLIDYINRGATYGQLGLQQQAINDFDCAIEIDPTNALSYTDRGASYAALGMYEKAIGDHTAAIDLDPTMALAFNNRGNCYALLDQHNEGLDDYHKAISLEPDLLIARLNRAKSYLALARFEDAIEDCNQAVRIEPYDPISYMLRGYCYENLSNQSEAVKNYSIAIEKGPYNAEAYEIRGQVYKQMGLYDQALADFNKTLQLNPERDSAYYRRGRIFAQSGQQREAIQDFSKAIQLNPEYGPYYLSRGMSYAALRNHTQAIQDYNQFISSISNDAVAYGSRGNSYVELGEYLKAIRDYDVAISLDSTNFLSFYNRGVCYGNLGRNRDAFDNYTQSLNLNPNHAPSLLNKGVILANLGRLQDALSLLEKAHSLGLQQAADVIQQVRHALGLPSMQVQINPHDPQKAFEAFVEAKSLDAMWQVVAQYPILRQMAKDIRRIINDQVPPDYRPAIENRLMWLQQVDQRLIWLQRLEDGE